LNFYVLNYHPIIHWIRFIITLALTSAWSFTEVTQPDLGDRPRGHIADLSGNMAPKSKSEQRNWADEMNSSSSSEPDDFSEDTRLSTPSSEQPAKLTRFEMVASMRANAASTSSNQTDEPVTSTPDNAKGSPTTTEAEVRQLVHKLVTSIFSNWSQLREVVETHEDKLRKRWETKTKGDKANILLQVWPNMSFAHRPDFHAFLSGDSGHKVQGKAEFKDAYMWPQINLEDLTYGRTLLLYVDSRGRHPPQAFVHADWASCLLGRRTNSVILSPLLKSYTMFLDGRTAIRYGRIVAWEKDPGAKDQLLAGGGCLTTKGLMVLEIQERIMSFLVQFCLVLLNDLTTSFTHNALTRPIPAADKSKRNVIAAEAPYRLPGGSDFKRLAKLILASRNFAEDHAYALRIHPGHFAATMIQAREHRYEMLLDLSGARHPALDTPDFLNSLIMHVIQGAYGRLFEWDLAYQQMVNVLRLSEKYSAELSPKKKLPEDYMQALLILRYAMRTIQAGATRRLVRLLPPSPAYRHMFSRVSLDQTKGGFRADPEVETDVVMGFFELIADNRKMHLLNPLDLTDELERAIGAEPKLKKKLSPLIALLVGDMGIVGQVYHELDVYQPWASGFEFIDKKHGEDAHQVVADEIGSKLKHFRGLNGLSLAEVGKPSKFDYPADQPRTLLTTETMKRSERNLWNFWRSFSQQYFDAEKVDFHDELAYLFVEKLNAGEEDDDTEATVKVNARALKIVKKLYYMGWESDPVGETPWKDLVYIMNLMEFEVEKLHGQS
jgi:hypothetical protein